MLTFACALYVFRNLSIYVYILSIPCANTCYLMMLENYIYIIFLSLHYLVKKKNVFICILLFLFPN